MCINFLLHLPFDTNSLTAVAIVVELNMEEDVRKARKAVLGDLSGKRPRGGIEPRSTRGLQRALHLQAAKAITRWLWLHEKYVRLDVSDIITLPLPVRPCSCGSTRVPWASGRGSPRFVARMTDAC